MIIYPAIDILNSKCVRLKKGDYSDSKVYSESPVKTAAEFKEAGACCLHIVDLDAAKSGIFTNNRIIEQIAEECGLSVQAGGGIRSIQAADRYFDAGVSTVVGGTAAVNDPDFLLRLTEKYPFKVCLALDCTDYELKTDGWQKGSGINIFDFAAGTKDLKLASVLATDISRDGMLSGPSFELYSELKKATDHKIIASGGISSEEDVFMLEKEGLDGAVIGKAVYEGRISLEKLFQRREYAG